MGEGKTVEAWDEWTAKMKAAHGNGNGHGASLAIEAQRLLPTPTSANAADGADPEAWEEARLALMEKGYNGNGRGTPLGIAVQSSWGQYADAIARWEALTRPAPPPTETGPKGNPRLSPAFSEWLMGLPAGWITDVPGVTRNEALKLAGNGVCPQQCEAALRYLLGVGAAPTATTTDVLPTPQAADAKGVRANTGGNPTLEGALIGYRPHDVAKHGRGSDGVA